MIIIQKNNVIEMLKKIISYVFLTGLLWLMACLIFPPSVSAQIGAKEKAPAVPSPSTAAPPPEGIAPSGSASLSNIDPLRNTGIQGLINNIFNIAYGAAGLVAVAYLIIGGYQYITSQGDPDATATAKGTIVNSIIGLIIILTSYLIIRFALDQLRVGGLLG